MYTEGYWCRSYRTVHCAVALVATKYELLDSSNSSRPMPMALGTAESAVAASGWTILILRVSSSTDSNNKNSPELNSYFEHEIMCACDAAPGA